MGPEAQLKAFIAKFDAPNQRLMRGLRAAMRRRLPRAHELVYDNYNFLVIAWCPSERVSDAYFSLGADAHGVNLFFGFNGTSLADPKGLLQGSGKLNRFVRLQSVKHLASDDVQALVRAAINGSKIQLHDATQPKLIIKLISSKQRPRRIANAVKPKTRAKPKTGAVTSTARKTQRKESA